MPFWNLFWLIVPAVTLLTLSVAFYLVTGREERTTSQPNTDSRPTAGPKR